MKWKNINIGKTWRLSFGLAGTSFMVGFGWHRKLMHPVSRLNNKEELLIFVSLLFVDIIASRQFEVLPKGQEFGTCQ